MIIISYPLPDEPSDDPDPEEPEPDPDPQLGVEFGVLFGVLFEQFEPLQELFDAFC